MTRPIALITGANQGIGKAAAVALGRMGAQLVLVCRNIDKAKTAVNDIRAAGGGEAVAGVGQVGQCGG